MFWLMFTLWSIITHLDNEDVRTDVVYTTQHDFIKTALETACLPVQKGLQIYFFYCFFAITLLTCVIQCLGSRTLALHWPTEAPTLTWSRRLSSQVPGKHCCLDTVHRPQGVMTVWEWQWSPWHVTSHSQRHTHTVAVHRVCTLPPTHVCPCYSVVTGCWN